MLQVSSRRQQCATVTAAAAVPGNVSRTPERGGQGRGLYGAPCFEMVLRARMSLHGVCSWPFPIGGDESLAIN